MKFYEKFLIFIFNGVTILLTTFIMLKLDGFINWSWLWVLSPIWCFAICYFIALIVLMLFVDALNDNALLKKYE